MSIQKVRDKRQIAALDQARGLSLSPRSAIAVGNGDCDGEKERETDENSGDVGELSVAPKTTAVETGVSDAESTRASTCGDLDDSCQTTGTSLRKHGRDLSTLTLGRIEDGFRRDRYDFPVDLKGRGHGRAAEARAVMQVPEAIDEVMRCSHARFSRQIARQNRRSLTRFRG